MYAVARDCVHFAILNDSIRGEFLGILDESQNNDTYVGLPYLRFRDRCRDCRILAVVVVVLVVTVAVTVAFLQHPSRCRQLLLFGCPLSANYDEAPLLSADHLHTHSSLRATPYHWRLNSSYRYLFARLLFFYLGVCTKQHRNSLSLTAPVSSFYSYRISSLELEIVKKFDN